MLKDIRSNPLVLTDAYNLSHQRLKISTEWEVSHMYNRKEGMILYGFHELVSTFLTDVKVTHEQVDEAMNSAKRMGLIFPEDLWRRVVNELDGFIPLRVEVLPEGTWCPAGTPFAQIANTEAGFGELVTWWEAVFMHAYFPSSCATEAYKMREYLKEKQDEYGYDDSFLSRFHSFGFRGHTSLENAYWAGTAWALFLKGTDDFHISKHLPTADLSSIAALAHKVTQQYDDEYLGFLHAIDATAEVGEKVVALVIDTYDAYNVINNMTVRLSNYASDRGVFIVLRPDSGDTWKQVVDIYDVVKDNGLDNVGAIIGEGMSLEEAKKADMFFEKNNVPLSFVSYGIGAGFYKHLERDTLGWAMKTAYSNYAPRMKFSENPMKRSMPGVVSLFYRGDELFASTLNETSRTDEYEVIYESNKYSNYTKVPDSFGLVQRRAIYGSKRQTYIKTTEGIKDLVRGFKDKYLKK
jgi:nicotinamide phosphoribosyltransferase